MKRVLKKIVQRLSGIDDVRVLILYGSFARREATSRSDIDLLILVKNSETIEKVQEEIIVLESEIDRTIQPTLRTIEELKGTDSGLLQNIFQEGKVLYLKEPAQFSSAVLLEQKPHIIYSFRLNKLDQREKAKFNRQFYGQRKADYEYQGFLQDIGGAKISPGCVIIPYRKKSDLEKFFGKFKVDFDESKVWK
jgi:predicted nucleotidyltransferase